MELVKNIFFNTDKLIENSKIKISYTGKFFEENSDKVFIHFGYGLNWDNISEIEMKKTDLISEVGISSSTLAKMSKGEVVSMEILIKICAYFDCDFGDIVSYSKKGEWLWNNS